MPKIGQLYPHPWYGGALLVVLKRSIKGTYVSVMPPHLDRYGDGQAFRFNEREKDDGGQFCMVASAVVGKRLTYHELIGRGAAKADAAVIRDRERPTMDRFLALTRRLPHVSRSEVKQKEEDWKKTPHT